MLSRGDLVYVFFLLVALIVLAILSVSGVLWSEYSSFAWVVIVVGGLTLLKPIANALGNSDTGSSFLTKMKNSFGEQYGS